MGRYRSFEKKCRRCKHPKTLDEFYAAPQNKDGLGPYCKPCAGEQNKEWNQTESGRASIRRKNKSEGRKKSSARYSCSKKGKENAGRYLLRHPEKRKARVLLSTAVKRGDIIKPTKCQISTRNCKGHIEGHHDDYDDPLDVEWFCVYHHRMIPW